MMSSKVFFAHTALFVVSYTPFFLYNFLIFVVDITVTRWEIVLANPLVYYLRFANCCLNPIIIFVLSKRYRSYIKRYCGPRKVQTATGSGNSIETSL